MTWLFAVAALVSVVGCIVALVLYFRSQTELERFNAIADVEDHMRECQAQTNATRSEHVQLQQSNTQLKKQYKQLERVCGTFQSLADVRQQTATAQQEYASQEQYYHNLLAQLKADIAAAEGQVAMQEFGFYHAKFNYISSGEYQQKLDLCREQQKQMVKAADATESQMQPVHTGNEAWICSTPWEVSGSRKDGIKKTKQQAKLMMRAFNVDCDNAIAKVKFNNVTTIEKRIRRSFDQINKLGQASTLTIVPRYCELKVEELSLAHELAVKKQEEREVELAHRAELREQEKIEKELKAAQVKAEQEEKAKERALAQARRELAASEGANTLKMKELIAKLESELTEAIDRKAKAIARAQLTKSGHVYILSNIGVFGEGVFKIGMTRRLEPLERVKELGSASVPFLFDVHAMIYTEDAPGLEKALHDYFADRRVNMVNQRKEFFRASLEEIQAAVAHLHGNVTFVIEPEAEEYYETLALEREREHDGVLVA